MFGKARGLWVPIAQLFMWPVLLHVMFLTARVWDTVHFVFSCGLESKSVNPLTVIVIPLHEKEVRELCVNKKSVPLLMDPRNLFCHHHSNLCGQIKDVMVHLGRFKNRLLIITSLFTQKNSAPEVKCVCSSCY